MGDLSAQRNLVADIPSGDEQLVRRSRGGRCRERFDSTWRQVPSADLTRQENLVVRSGALRTVASSVRVALSRSSGWISPDSGVPSSACGE